MAAAHLSLTFVRLSIIFHQTPGSVVCSGSKVIAVDGTCAQERRKSSNLLTSDKERVL